MNIVQKPVRHFSAGRPFGIDAIMIHHFAGNLTTNQVRTILNNRGVSYHYGIGSDRVAQFVQEGNRAWHAGDGVGNRSRGNDRSIGIGVANNGGAPNWTVSNASFDRLVTLCTQIARRRGWRQLVVGQNLLMHSNVRNTACPGPHLRGRIAELARRVNASLAPVPAAPRPPAPATNQFFPRTSAGGGSIVAALNSIGVDSSFANRTRIARANGVTNYTGTAAQNTRLLQLLRAGQLRRP